MNHQNRRQFTVSLMGVGTALAALGKVSLGAEEGFAAPVAKNSVDHLFSAIRSGDLDRVKGLLEREPRLAFASEAGGLSAFALALLTGQRPIGDLIRGRGYRPDVHEEALGLDWERFDLLASEAPGELNRNHPIGGSAMYAAALGGAGSDLWRVYRYGADPSLTFSDSRFGSPLQAALSHPDLGTAEITAAALLSNGADPSPTGHGTAPPLHVAARRGSLDIVEMLVSKGVDVGVSDGEGLTALERAESEGHAAVARALRDHGEIPREHSSSRRAYAVDGERYSTPDLGAFAVQARERIVGVSHRSLEDVRAVVERHPDLAHAVASTTEGAIEAAAHMGHRDIVDYLLERGAPYSLPTAVMRADGKRVRELLDEDPARINERGAHDFALLWYPIIGCTGPGLMEELLRRGADVERQHFLGTTALHFAAARDQMEMVELLVANGADVNRIGRKFRAEGQRPLDLARGRIADYLRSRGARTRDA